MSSFEDLLQQIKACTVCAKHLPLGPRPVVSIGPNSKILVIGQAPGTKVHDSGIPWDDASGKNLRKWLGVTNEKFYNTDLFGIVPMGFCYPGKGKSGDLPPRPECAPLWHSQIFDHLKEVKLTLLIGQYAQGYYLGKKKKKTLTETVQNYEAYLPEFFPLVHPSPRNGIWIRKNPWFEEEIIPNLQRKVQEILT
ncbi:uracil-DNA glycosylase family protein [Roseivirga echinicomitans]|uniref:IclR family transcriptional regulator n=1 Tax=Roseivirga echinicomitans TaxID=296218 RepID=A0A150XSP3_9BACT|nr:uracil-DNA glycosylase family protein [Roseivirga echinicomitans]KYG81767.1 IclR family transcriptional regulator [Roseivirga echinicomitans]